MLSLPLISASIGLGLKEISDFSILKRGEGMRVGLMTCRILGKEGPFLDKILEEGSGRLVWGSGSVIPAVEMLIARSGLGGTARCSLRLPPDCWNPFYQHSIRCCLEVQSEARQHFAGVKQDVVKLFDPPMAEQVLLLKFKNPSKYIMLIPCQA